MTTDIPSVTIALPVHYMSFGTPGGEYAPTCRAATVTEVGENGLLGLAVLNPTGLFFRSLADGGCQYNGEHRPSGRAGGTWHLTTDCWAVDEPAS